MLPPLRTGAAVVLATAVAAIAASARADTPPPATYNAHGVTFRYPADWMELPVSYEIKIGTPLWIDTIGPAPQLPPTNGAAPPSPAPSPDVVTLSAAHVAVALTKRNIGRYKKYFAVTVAQLAASAHGQVESGPTRVKLGGLPGYAFRLTAQRADGTILENRMVYAFKQKTEYFVNCEHPQNDPLAPEIENGCSQIMQSFRLAK